MINKWDPKRIFKFLLAAIFLISFAVLFVPFAAEILLAAVFALAMEPTLGRWLQPRQLRWRTSVAFILIGMFVVIALPVTMVGYKGYGTVMEISKTGFQNTEIFKKMIFVKTEGLNVLNRVLAKLGLEDQVNLEQISGDSLSSVANVGISFFTGLINQIPSILLSVFVFCAALYYFLAEGAVIRRTFNRQQLMEPHITKRFVEVLQKACSSTVTSSIIIGVMQAAIVSVGALICEAGDFLVVFVTTFFVSFIPVIGAAPVALALAGYKALLGDYGQAIGLGVVAVIAGTSDNLVRPYLISSTEENLHPIVSLLAIIGALIVFGMPGLLLGPVIASVAVNILPTLYDTYGPPAKDAKVEDSLS